MPLARLASWTTGPARPTVVGRASGLSSMPNSPVPRAKRPSLRILRFHSPQTNHADRSTAPFKASERFETLPSAGRCNATRGEEGAD
jgi:hypothetical protein